MNNQKFYQKESFFNSPDKTMELVLEAISEIIPYELAVILGKSSSESLRVLYTRGPLLNKKLQNYEIPINKYPYLKEGLNIARAKLVQETHDPDHHDVYEELIELPSGHSCMLIPLRVNDETLGLMTLDHRHCGMFTPERVRLANTLSKLITLALSQALVTDSLLNEKEALIYERNSFIEDITTVVEGLIGKSPIWIRVIDKIKLVAPTESNVIILGETGTGKKQVAKAIHALSKRSSKPFITLNCSALNNNLAESALFGNEKGYFTGAADQQKGRFELADNGILFLDEISDLPLEIQPKLLRAIKDGTFEKPGGEKTYCSNVRVLCSTRFNLREKVKEGKFMEDLFNRLNVFPIQLPPLRNRKEDILLLTNYFLYKLSEKLGNRKFLITADAVERLTLNSWNGNVRELHNSLELAAILCEDGVIKTEHIVLETSQKKTAHHESTNESLNSFDEETRKIIKAALEKTNGKIYGNNGAAALLNMKPTTLQSKMKKLNI